MAATIGECSSAGGARIWWLTIDTVGGCLDTSLIIDFLAAYLFPHGERVIDEFAATGISLGGKVASTRPGREILS